VEFVRERILMDVVRYELPVINDTTLSGKMFQAKKNLFPSWMVIQITSRLKCKNPTTRMIIRCNDPITIVSKR
jgi:hypothetical protein